MRVALGVTEKFVYSACSSCIFNQDDHVEPQVFRSGYFNQIIGKEAVTMLGKSIFVQQ